MNTSLLYGFGAILLWSTLASTGNFLKTMPPFLLLTLTLGIAGLGSLLHPKEAFKSNRFIFLGQFGYFGYHFFLFLSFRFISPVKANLINYLWPMFLILFSSLIFKEFKLKINHFIGAILSFSGCAWLILSQSSNAHAESLWGYLFAFLPAVIWPLFSLLSKKLGEINFWQICGACLVSALLSLPLHLLFEEPHSLTSAEWIATIYIGIGPMALGFYWWEKAMKSESIFLGLISYLTPLISTTLLVLTTGGEFSTSILIAVLLILCGSFTGVLDKFRQRS